jgi:DNA-binding CsgD family transcriptional regulator
MNSAFPNLKQSSFLQSVLEGFIDGVLILTDQGEWIHANDCARRICQQLNAGVAQSDRVPHKIWNACKCLIDSFNIYSSRAVVIEDEIQANNSASYRLRAQWLELESGQRPCMLVTLEDRLQSIQSAAIAEAQRYGFTARELEVWLRYRTGYSYKDIAAELFISLNTVKKHMKNSHAKRHSDELVTSL